VDRNEILVRLSERIRAFAASHYGRDLADDVAQEVMIVLHERYGHLDSLDDLLPLAFKIARLKIMGMRRKSVRRGEPGQLSVDELPLADDAPDAEVLAGRREMAERLALALPKLGDRCREIFRLKLESRSFPEIQKILGASNINTVYTWEARCRKRLLELMGGSWEAKR
jgi:RNA polymerase sigma-70 factor (ECF subfamily)